MTVRVVTDSTAYLPAAIVADAGLTVVPLTVAVDGDAGFEGVEVAPADVARALVQRRGTVTTSRPSPAQFSEAYRRLFDAGRPGSSRSTCRPGSPAPTRRRCWPPASSTAR
jgi:fatty acid-binding protein DegV